MLHCGRPKGRWLDVQLKSIVENVLVFGGIEAGVSDAGRVQYLTQVWRVTVPEN
jgi:hypothetical protein